MRILAIVHQPDAGPGVFAEATAAAGERLELWRPAENEAAPTRLRDYDAIFSFGGGMHPDQEEAHPWLVTEKRFLAQALEEQIPLLGVCLGAELLAEAAGGSARPAPRPEIGWCVVQTAPEAARDPLLAALPPRFEALEWHSYETALPPQAVALAWSDACLQAFRVGELAWGIQFHAEATLPTIESWLARYRTDPDAVRIRPDALRVQARSAISGWNRLGRELCTQFLRVADPGGAGVQQRAAG